MPGDHPTIDSDTILLPAHLRLPDLSRIRAITDVDLDRWHQQALAATYWGPDRRNGCTRNRTPTGYAWFDAHGDLHSPDEWTPAHGTYTGAHWYQHGQQTSRHGQPSGIGPNGLTWAERTVRHRTDGPAVLNPPLREPFWWHGIQAPPRLVPALLTAWTDLDLTDDQAHDLLDTAAAVEPGKLLPVTPQAWLARVLAVNPSAALTEAARAWLALLTT